MPTQTSETEDQQANQGIGITMKHDWLVENDDARKTLHDLYFETGSLPHQQPKIKAKELEKAKPVEQLTQTAPSGTVENGAYANSINAGVFKRSRVKRTAYITAALFLAFLAYRVMPNLEMTPSKTAPRHTQSPLIREALERRQAANPSPQPVSNLLALGSLAVTPAVIFAQYQPGQSTTQTLTVNNQTPHAMTFEMEAEDLVAQGEKLILVPAGDSSDSVAATAMFSQKYVRVEPMDRATVQVTLTWPASTTVRGVLARLRGTDDVHLGGTGTMTASLGTLITLARTQDSGVQEEAAPAGLHPSETHFIISQWSTESGSTPAGSGNPGTPNNSRGIKVANFASLGRTQ